MNWQIGDRAIHINDGGITDPIALQMVGEECTILQPATTIGFDWDVDIRGKGFTCMESCLRPIPDDKSTWEELEKIIDWNPSRFKVTCELEKES